MRKTRGQSLVELALRLPPEAAPTIFQISSLLSNDEWRIGVLPLLPFLLLGGGGI